MATVGLLHPGEMGAAVGGCLVSVGHEVLWDPAGRSRATTGRALAAELTGVKFDRLIANSSVIFSICPPHAALDVAHQVAAAGYTGCYVDANAISVDTAHQRATEVRFLCNRSPLAARMPEGEPSAASSVKMAYAAWTKGIPALLLAAR